MRKIGWRGVSLMGAAALLLWACSEGGDDPTRGLNAAGDTSETAGGNAASGGAGGAPNDCEVPTLEVGCAGRDCPESLDDFDLPKLCERAPYETAVGVDRYASDCDGVVIEVWGEAGYRQATTYSFDEQGNLLGFTFGDDVARECPSVVGATCQRVGKAESLCPPDGAGGAGGAAGAAGAAGAGGTAGAGGAGGSPN